MLNEETKIKICEYIANKLLGDKYQIALIRKGWLDEVARDVNRFPQSKIPVLKILRLDGTSFQDAMKKYQEMNNDNQSS